MSDGKALDARPRSAPAGPRLGRIHDRVFHVLAEIDAGAPADKALSAAFRRARDLGSHDRAHIREEVYGLLRRRSRAQDLLERGMKALRKDISLLDAPVRLRLQILTHLALEGASLTDLEARDRFAARRIPKLFERILAGRLPRPKRSEEAEGALATNLPQWMFRRLAAGVGAEQARVIGEALLHRAPVCLRADPTRISREQLLERLEAAGIDAHPTPIAPHGVLLDDRAHIKDWPELNDARVEVQDEGSQLVALALGAQPGERVLDACAGAGGKTLALWSAMQGKGELLALEPDKKKLDALRTRLGAAGATGVRVRAGGLEELPEEEKGRFQRVLVDAPCTGTGTLRRHPDLKWRLDESQVTKEADRQIRLLGGAVGALAPGGIVVYATCSVLREENEHVVEQLCRAAPEVEPVSLETLLGPELAKAAGIEGPMARIGPGPEANGPDGFFIAALRRKDT